MQCWHSMSITRLVSWELTKREEEESSIHAKWIQKIAQIHAQRRSWIHSLAWLSMGLLQLTTRVNCAILWFHLMQQHVLDNAGLCVIHKMWSTTVTQVMILNVLDLAHAIAGYCLTHNCEENLQETQLREEYNCNYMENTSQFHGEQHITIMKMNHNSMENNISQSWKWITIVKMNHNREENMNHDCEKIHDCSHMHHVARYQDTLPSCENLPLADCDTCHSTQLLGLHPNGQGLTKPLFTRARRLISCKKKLVTLCNPTLENI